MLGLGKRQLIKMQVLLNPGSSQAFEHNFARPTALRTNPTHA